MKSELIAQKNPKSPNSEIFRTLRTNIQFMNIKKKIKTLLITSTFPAEGKSWVASNLAVTFAQAGKKVVLIDADMRKGRLYRIFEVSPKPGLSNYLSEADIDENGKSSIDIASYIQETEISNLYVVPAGNVPPNPSELLVSPQMIGVLEDLKKICDLVIIDGTPCELVTDSIILSRIVDCTVIVAAYKLTKKDALDRVIKNIQNVGGNLAGVVLNKYSVSKKYNQQYYYYGESSKNKKKNNKYKKTAKRLNDFNSDLSNNKFEHNVSSLYKDIHLEKDIDTFKNIKTEAETKTETKIENETENHNFVENNENTNNYTQSNNQENESEKKDVSSIIPDAKIDSEQSFINKTNEIMKQINDYLNEQKNNFK